jgi:hypothetical protein
MVMSSLGCALKPGAAGASTSERFLPSEWLEADPELVGLAEEFEYTHDGNLLMIGAMVRAAIVTRRFLLWEPFLSPNSRYGSTSTCIVRRRMTRCEPSSPTCPAGH